MTRRRSRLIGNHDCGDGKHAVATLECKGGEDGVYNRREPCEQCPWRKDVPVGVFPAEAYRHSAATAYDAAQTVFACHMNGSKSPLTCAGFLLQNSANNLAVRMALFGGRVLPVNNDGGAPLYDSYRAMAIANGVDANDPVLAPCRGDDEPWEEPRS